MGTRDYQIRKQQFRPRHQTFLPWLGFDWGQWRRLLDPFSVIYEYVGGCHF